MYVPMRFVDPQYTSNPFEFFYGMKKIGDFQCSLKELHDQAADIWSKSEVYISQAEVRKGGLPHKGQRFTWLTNICRAFACL